LADSESEVPGMTQRDFWQEPSAKAWVHHVLDDMVPKLESSALVAMLVPDDREGDVKFWVELGASIMMNKPIIAIVFTDAEVPPKLASIADEIVRCPRGVNLQASEAVAAAVKRVLAK
jgi:hypothetical protein